MRKMGKVLFLYFVLILIAATYIVPFIFIILSAFKAPVEIFDLSKMFIFELYLVNFEKAFAEYFAHLALKNSVIVLLPSTALVVLISSFAAYALARFRFRGRETLALDILTLRMFPPVVSALPIYLISSALGLLNTHWILILVYTVFNLPLAIWLMKTFIEDIPFDVEEAATVDGASQLTVLWRITFPLLTPGIIATAVLTSIFIWNEFLFALLLTGGIETKTLPVVAAQAMKMRYIAWGEACAIGVITTLPLLALFAIVQKYLLRALTFGLVR